MEIKQIKELKKLFNEKQNSDEENKEIPEEKRKGYITSCCVLMFIPKTTYAEAVFKSVFDCEEKPIPELNYNKDNAGGSKYSAEYLIRILEFIKSYGEDESIRITTGRDFPITFEGKEFKIILAPREL